MLWDVLPNKSCRLWIKKHNFLISQKFIFISQQQDEKCIYNMKFNNAILKLSVFNIFDDFSLLNSIQVTPS